MRKYSIFFLEIVMVIIIFCSLTTVKYLFPKTFNLIKEFYITNFCVETEIELVIGE